MADVDGELEHCEAVAHQVLAELGCCLAFLLGIGWEVKEHENPHNPVLAEARGIVNHHSALQFHLRIAEFAQFTAETLVE